jgi:VIT1/CCC1 family predicted Fe2+/Mn2+ transporter
MQERKGFLRNFIFGAEDGLVSTVGLLSGVSFAGLGSRAVIVSGVILILVEALSMAAGVYISEDSTNELETTKARQDNILNDSIIMFLSYLFIGLIPLLPYTVTSDTRLAFYWSIAGTIIALFLLGLFKAHFVGKSLLRSALKLTLIGVVVVALSVAVGVLIKI